MAAFSKREIILKVGPSPEGEKRMRLFCDAVEAGESPHPDDIEWFADVFSEYLNDDKPIKKALKLTKTRGRKRTALDDEREVYVVFCVLELMKLHGGQLTKDDAIDEVAAQFNKSRDTISNYYDEHRRRAEQRIPEIRKTKREAEAFAKKATAQIAAIEGHMAKIKAGLPDPPKK